MFLRAFKALKYSARLAQYVFFDDRSKSSLVYRKALGLTSFGHITHTLLVDWGACIGGFMPWLVEF